MTKTQTTTDEPEVSVEWARGMHIEVTHTHDEYERQDDGSQRRIEVETTDTGVITAVPSRRFNRDEDDHDFDYQLQLPGVPGGAIRSVDIDAGVVEQLHYDAGGDRDWDTFLLESITVTRCK